MTGFMLQSSENLHRPLEVNKKQSDAIFEFFCDGKNPFNELGPISLVRTLFSLAKRGGVTTMTYHLMDPLEPLRAHPAYSHFGKSRVLSRKRISPEMEANVLLTHALVLKKGVPTSIASLLPSYLEKEPKKTRDVMARLNEIDISDEYMIPVYGPNSINAVISFGFPSLTEDVSEWKLEMLENAAQICHVKMVRHFKKRQPRVQLSRQEKAVLTWIARGKSNSEIATILSLSNGSVDTYVRRVFEKMGVNNRVSAAIRGLLTNLISV